MGDLTWNKEDAEWLKERFLLMEERLGQICLSPCAQPAYEAFFQEMAAFLLKTAEIFKKQEAGLLAQRSMAECKADQEQLYAHILPAAYETSYANPAYAVAQHQEAAGRLLSFLCSELEGCIAAAFQGRLTQLTILFELFVQVYNALEEDDVKEAESILYWFFHDYSELFVEQQLYDMLCPENNFFVEIIKNADLSDLRYLYAFGLPVGENELGIARFLGTLSEAEIQAMADTYTEGYRLGFVAAGIDLSKKKTVELDCPLGFERMMRAAIANFEKMGLAPTLSREASSSFFNKGRSKRAFYSTSVNRQYDFDHRDDKAMYLDKGFVNRRLEVYQTVFSRHKEAALLYAGPAVVEVFGEEPFAPQAKEEALHLSGEQQQLNVEMTSRAGEILYTYIPGETRSYTIIAYPLPEIGPDFEEIFAETVKINTLDYTAYQRMQQCIIDALDGAGQVHIAGCGGNRTDLTVSIRPLQDPQKETAFENCVADVNIPVGEVFTSPVLAGTNGVLHVSRVFLNGLQYKDLEITFTDGMISDYTCKNFETEEENKAYVKANVLMHHDTLPMGEFAIGTNTTAYVMAKRFDIAQKLPILIAEKTGPHFAVGDTCYSHEEEVVRRNPDGKEIVARENEVSALRKSSPQKAYFNCHTDITIPYEELGAIVAIRADGTQIDIIRDGLFRVPGTEELNTPLYQQKL